MKHMQEYVKHCKVEA